ncbi:MAG: isoprenylcysteine carboxylmethyltransferase family protein [Chloroflexi bacterium]|nr:isoprenylcysteine carboxylmethyltransferase family protein [Chloroflexota bacterium]
MWKRFLKQAQREYGPKQRLAVLLAAAALFVVILPLALLYLGRLLDRGLDWPVLLYPPVNAIVGSLMVLAGWLLAMWTIYLQFTLGRGTPVPVVATQKLIICPPYSYCRNPMALGTIVLYGGVSVAAGALGAAVLVVLGAGALLIYIKVVEEQEMVARFGDEYLAYRRRVPFIIPRLGRRG